MVPTLIEAAENLEQVMPEDGAIKEVVADKGSHSTATMKEFKALDLRSYVSEPDRGGRKWKGDLECQSPRYIPHPVTKVIPPILGDIIISSLSGFCWFWLGKLFPTSFLLGSLRVLLGPRPALF